MRVLKKTKGPADNSETTVVTDTVILGTKEKNTPAALVVDENGILDIEKLSDNKESECDPAPDSGKSRRKLLGNSLLGNLLKILRWPENALIQAYYKSNIRNKLHSKFEWYRNFEGEQQLNNKLDNVYGGTNSLGGNLTYFAKNNILVSLIIVGVSFQLFANFLSNSTENYRYTEREHAPSEPVQPVAATAKPGYLNVINHCAVTEGLRQFYDGSNDRALKSRVTDEIEGFIRVYSNSDIEQWYADQQSKIDSVIAQIQSTLPRIRGYRDQIAAEVSTVMQQYSDLKARLNVITTSDSHSLKDVNNSIKYRTQLAGIESRVARGPSTDSLDELDNQLHRLRAILSGGEVAPNPTSNWAKNTGNQDQATLVSSIRDIIDKDMDANIKQDSQDSPESRLYKLQIVIATLRHFGDLVGYLQNSPNYFEVQVGNQQSSSNHRIQELLGTEGTPPDAKFLNYDNCLTALNTAPTKLTVN